MLHPSSFSGLRFLPAPFPRGDRIAIALEPRFIADQTEADFLEDSNRGRVRRTRERTDLIHPEILEGMREARLHQFARETLAAMRRMKK